MFLLPLLVLALVGVALYRAIQHRHHIATTAGHGGVTATRAPFWPQSFSGRLGIGAVVLQLVNLMLVNVIQVPFLGWAFVLAGLGLTVFARIAEHDRATSVLIVLIVSAVAIAAALAFLVGESLNG